MFEETGIENVKNSPPFKQAYWQQLSWLPVLCLLC